MYGMVNTYIFRKGAVPIGEHFPRQRRDIHARRLALQDISERFKVRIPATYRRVFHLERRDVGATCDLVVRVRLPDIILSRMQVHTKQETHPSSGLSHVIVFLFFFLDRYILCVPWLSR
jgi:hypothetical protein